MLKHVRLPLHFALVWTTITLLAVDPVSACRLLVGRRCCTSCQVSLSCSDVACSDALPAGLEPKLELAPESSLSDRSEDRDAPPKAALAPLEQAEIPAPVTTAAPPPASIAPATPATTDAAKPIETPPPQPASDRAATSQPAAPAATTPPAALAPAAKPLTIEPARPAAASPPPPAAVPTVPKSATPMPPRTPPASSPAPMPAAPIMPPTFPPVDDDPFAPSPAAGSKKKANIPAAPAPRAPVSDDPFAPLPASSATPPAEVPQSDDPFAPLPASSPAAARPKVASPTASKSEDKLADAQRGTDGRLLVREWSDLSGQFRVQARLVLILDGKVRLLKETGRTTTVPVERLSASDRAYVADVIARYGSDLLQLDQLAAR